MKKRYESDNRLLPRRQDGVVLVVVLLLLLLTTIVGFQVMETSTLESRMAVAREGKDKECVSNKEKT